MGRVPSETLGRRRIGSADEDTSTGPSSGLTILRFFFFLLASVEILSGVGDRGRAGAV